MQLWIRLGDGGEYESFGDDFDALADAITESGITEIRNWIVGGFQTDAFDGYNYVSLYWGDDDANLLRQLANTERKQVEEILRKLRSCE